MQLLDVSKASAPVVFSVFWGVTGGVQFLCSNLLLRLPWLVQPEAFWNQQGSHSTAESEKEQVFICISCPTTFKQMQGTRPRCYRAITYFKDVSAKFINTSTDKICGQIHQTYCSL